MSRRTVLAGDARIRPYRADDYPAVDDIRRLAFAPVFVSLRALLGTPLAAAALADAEREQEVHLQALVAPGSASTLFVCEFGGRVVGFCACTLNAETRIGEIGLNAVHPAVQSQGIGSALYAHALAHLRAGGMRVAGVATGGDPSHAPARRAYEKAGLIAGIPTVFLYRTL